MVFESKMLLRRAESNWSLNIFDETVVHSRHWARVIPLRTEEQ